MNRRAFRWVAATLVGAGCAADPESGLYVVVEPAASPIEHVVTLDVSVMVAGHGAASFSVPDLPGQEFTIGRKTLSVHFDRGVQGTAMLDLVARSAAGGTLATGGWTGTIVAGRAFEARVKLKVSALPDGGSDAPPRDVGETTIEPNPLDGTDSGADLGAACADGARAEAGERDEERIVR